MTAPLAALRRGDQVTLTVTSIANGGDAISRLGEEPGLTVFLDRGVPGDRVLARIEQLRPRFVRATVLDLLDESPVAVVPECPVEAECGGCRFWRLPYDEELAIKAREAAQTLTRIGRGAAFPELDVIAATEPRSYRERARLRLGSDGEVGFLAAGSHRLVGTDRCAVLRPELDATRPTIRALFARIPAVSSVFVEWDDERQGVALTAELDASDATHAFRTVRARLDRMPPLDGITTIALASGRRTRVLLGDGEVHRRRPLAGAQSVVVREPVGGFSQANGRLNGRLQRAVLDACGAPPAPGAPLLELFSGAGNFTLPLLGAGWDVDAVEGAGHAIQAAANAWRTVGDAARGSFRAWDLERGLPPELTSRLHEYSTVVVDPARGGLPAAVVGALAGFVGSRLIYVSCDVAALARDAAALQSAGWSARQLTLVDMFPRTPHVELVAVFDAEAVSR
ncbi:MAG: class I SAM-dependent RNA methyltransferase [Myxococcales bacterium]|nr:class I SAM-dependent RNA methyltransferase [Myxococcales bacterium]MCB9521643.1 class I SAM-dependent RNA methyltransferase [Myxococcales bacterium]MCB9531599.1 class I SAM-dependent RNA methyltransferase [Myxococcales bacterium]MCB9532749.1 class I SAM-dependent RNA methyltransferase [Myxococcales bacterium]